MRSGSPSALRTTCFSHTFSTNVFGLSISVLPILRVLVSFPTIVDREPSRPSRRPPRHHVQANVIQGRLAVHRSHLLCHPRCEGAPLLLRQLLQVPAQHDRPEEAGELVHRIERRDLAVQPGLDLFEARGLQTSRRRPGVGVVLVVLPAHETVRKALLFHRLLRRPRGAGDVTLAPALGDEAPARLYGPRQILEEAIMVPYPVERCRGEDQIHTRLYLEGQQILALHPYPRLSRKPPPRRLDHGPRTVYGQH